MKRITLLLLVLSFAATMDAQKEKMASSIVQKLTFNGEKVIVNDSAEKYMSNLVIQMSLPLNENKENEIDDRYKAVSLSYTPHTGWNTLALPFIPTKESIEQIFGIDYVLYSFGKYENGKIHIDKLYSLEEIVTGQPFIVYVPDNAVLGCGPFAMTDITLNKDPQTVVDDFSGVRFWGTFTASNDDHNHISFELNSKGTINKIENEVAVKAFHGYFDLSTVEGETDAFTLDNGETTTGIASFPIRNRSNFIFDLQGRRVFHMSRGIYIMGDKKVVVHDRK